MVELRRSEFNLCLGFWELLQSSCHTTVASLKVTKVQGRTLWAKLGIRGSTEGLGECHGVKEQFFIENNLHIKKMLLIAALALQKNMGPSMNFYFTTQTCIIWNIFF